MANTPHPTLIHRKTFEQKQFIELLGIIKYQDGVLERTAFNRAYRAATKVAVEQMARGLEGDTTPPATASRSTQTRIDAGMQQDGRMRMLLDHGLVLVESIGPTVDFEAILEFCMKSGYIYLKCYNPDPRTPQNPWGGDGHAIGVIVSEGDTRRLFDPNSGEQAYIHEGSDVAFRVQLLRALKHYIKQFSMTHWEAVRLEFNLKQAVELIKRLNP